MPYKMVSCPECSRTVRIYGDECDRCGVKLEKVELIEDNKYSDQFKDSSRISVRGGYGMFFDGPPIDMVLCKKCSKEHMKFLGVNSPEYPGMMIE